jgi:hypothetical protein
VNFDGNNPSVQNKEAPLFPVNSNEECKVDSMTKLKERLQLVEMNCSRLESLYQKYRLHWLEENHQTRVLEEYTPNAISTCSPCQIPWDAPSPTQSMSEVCSLEIH